MSELLIDTSSGLVQGFLDRDIPNWRGVPYGRVHRRFRPPAEARPGDHLDATRWGPMSWQVQLYAGASWRIVYPELVENEDCLNLNIWSPAADGGRRPVLVWLHPGGRVAGSGSTPMVDAWVFAARHDAVVVTANYRLGPWGWLYFGDIDPAFADSANLPVLDQIRLLHWVRDNAAQFGGDPDNVTLFGMSSGATDVGTLLGAPAAHGLFHKAALYSGNAESPTSPADVTRKAEAFLAAAGALGGTPAELAVAPNVALRYVHRQLLRTPSGDSSSGRVTYGPFVDGRILPRSPLDSVAAGDVADVPVLVSVVADEARAYDATPGMIARMYTAMGGAETDTGDDEKIHFLSDKLFFQPAQRLLAAVHRGGGTGWSQVFDYTPSNSPVGQAPVYKGRPVHGVDQSALFIDPEGTEGSDTDRSVGAEEQTALMGLARDTGPAWAPWSPEQPQPHRMTG